MKSLRHFDMNQVVVLNALFRFQSVSKAANFLNLSQPAVSIALRKLRDYFQDPLFVKADGCLQPTPLARSLEGKVKTIISGMEGIVTETENFDPPNSTFHFRIGMPEYASFGMVDALMKHLEEHAPKITLTVVHMTRHNNIEEDLGHNTGLIIGNFRKPNFNYSSVTLFQDDFICLYKKGMFQGQTMTQDDFLRTPHIKIGTGQGDDPSVIDANIRRHGYERQNVISVPHYMLGLKLAESTGNIFTCPEKLSRSFVDYFQLDCSPYPFAIEERNISCLWHNRYSRSHAYMWLRDVLISMTKDFR